MRRDIAQWLSKWQSKYERLCDWVEENIEETLTYFRLPLPHHKHMKSTNMLERLNQELKRRTHVVRIFPNAESCLRLVRALAVETHESWLEGTRYPQHGPLGRTQEAGAAAGGMTRDPTCPSLAPCSPPSRPLRAACGGGLRPVLTAAARGATLSSGRDEETVPSVEQRNGTRYQTFLQNFSHTTVPGQQVPKMIDEIAREIAIRSYALPECLHVPVAAVDEGAISTYVGEILQPGWTIKTESIASQGQGAAAA